MSQQPDLSKRPEGATHWHPRVDGYEAHWAKIDGEKSYFCVTGFEAGGWVLDVKRPPSSRLVELPPVAVGWNGIGTPPAGSVCEARTRHVDWLPVTIRYVGEERIISHDGESERCWLIAHCEFRAIRKPDQIPLEDRQKVVMAIGDILIASRGNSNEYHQAGLIYDAGYRKQAAS